MTMKNLGWSLCQNLFRPYRYALIFDSWKKETHKKYHTTLLVFAENSESVKKVLSGSGSRNLASRAVSDKRIGKNRWHWLAGKLVTDFRDFNRVHSRLNRGHSKTFCLCFSSRWKLALSVLWADMSSFCPHSILAGRWTVAMSATLSLLTGRIF